MLLIALGSTAHAANLPRKEQLTDIDLQWMQVKKREVDDLARRHLGTQISGDKYRDFKILQDLLDKRLVSSSDTEILQGMGFVLGDILAKEQHLRWIVYIDGYGRSRALDIPNKPDVVFPVTSIARRHEVGAPVNVASVYQKLVDSVAYIRSRFYVNEMQ
jgi:hypothetical protein